MCVCKWKQFGQLSSLLFLQAPRDKVVNIGGSEFPHLLQGNHPGQTGAGSLDKRKLHFFVCLFKILIITLFPKPNKQKDSKGLSLPSLGEGQAATGEESWNQFVPAVALSAKDNKARGMLKVSEVVKQHWGQGRQ